MFLPHHVHLTPAMRAVLQGMARARSVLRDAMFPRFGLSADLEAAERLACSGFLSCLCGSEQSKRPQEVRLLAANSVAKRSPGVCLPQVFRSERSPLQSVATYCSPWSGISAAKSGAANRTRHPIPITTEKNLQPALRARKISWISREARGWSSTDNAGKVLTQNHLADAAALFVRRGDASVAHLQRHFRIGYCSACDLMSALEAAGVVGAATAQDNIRRVLVTENDMRHPSPEFVEASLREFEGCDCTDPGSPSDPYVWMFGLEFGEMPTSGTAAAAKASQDNTYSVREQLGYTYNRNAFKLLAVANGRQVQDYERFAHEVQPFVKGSRGYFKGNLYPYACKNVGEWPSDARTEVGLEKEEYRLWCDKNRIPVLHSWVNKYQPKLFIGVGLSAANLFAQVVFGKDEELREIKFEAKNGQVKRILQREDGWRKLVVLPHLSGGMNGLNSDDSLETAGRIVGNLVRS